MSMKCRTAVGSRVSNQWMFEYEPMSGKSVTCVPGIGEIMSTRLKDLDIEQADELYGQWLVFHKDVEKFGPWLQRKISCSNRTVQTIHTAFMDWSITFLDKN